MKSQIEEEFDQAMMNIYFNAKEECNYNATYFLRMLGEHGGRETAKKLLASSSPQYGFDKLWECGRLDLTVEALVISDKFKKLFSEQELAIARKRLKDYDYFIR